MPHPKDSDVLNDRSAKASTSSDPGWEPSRDALVAELAAAQAEIARLRVSQQKTQEELRDRFDNPVVRIGGRSRPRITHKLVRPRRP